MIRAKKLSVLSILKKRVGFHNEISILCFLLTVWCLKTSFYLRAAFILFRRLLFKAIFFTVGLIRISPNFVHAALSPSNVSFIHIMFSYWHFCQRHIKYLLIKETHHLWLMSLFFDVKDDVILSKSNQNSDPSFDEIQTAHSRFLSKKSFIYKYVFLDWLDQKNQLEKRFLLRKFFKYFPNALTWS